MRKVGIIIGLILSFIICCVAALFVLVISLVVQRNVFFILSCSFVTFSAKSDQLLHTSSIASSHARLIHSIAFLVFLKRSSQNIVLYSHVSIFHILPKSIQIYSSAHDNNLFNPLIAAFTHFNIHVLILSHIAEKISFEFVARFTVTVCKSLNTPLAKVHIEENNVQKKVQKDW